MLNPFLDNNHIGDPIITAINATLGDLKNQPKRYDLATLAAVKHDTPIITPQTIALRRDIERREALKVMLELTDILTIIADMEVLLTHTFEIPEVVFYEKKARFGAAITIDNLLTFVYDSISGLTDEQAQDILRKYAARYAFHYNSEADLQKELQQFLDARINALCIHKLIGGLNQALETGALEEQRCHIITEHLIANNAAPTGTNALYITILAEYIRKLKRDDHNQPVVYFSIGCGIGHSDVNICEQLKQRIPGLELRVVGFDPFVTDLEHNLLINELNGKIVNHAISHEESFLDLIEQELGTRHNPVIATDRYALHHMGYSIEEVRRKLQGICLISVEEPITLIQRTNLYYRLTKLGWDLLANYAFEVRQGGDWISGARGDSELFGVLYRRSEELEEESRNGAIRIQVVGANPLRQTCIIIYNPGVETSAAAI